MIAWRVAVLALSITACGGATSTAGQRSVPAGATGVTVAAVPAESVPAETGSSGLATAPPATSSAATAVPTTISALAAEIAAGAADLPSAVYDAASASDAAPTVVPAAISIPALGVTAAPVEPVGVTDAGELDVPDPTVVGWYRFGPTPDQAGSTVLAAHVDFNRVPGVFRYLTKLDVGDEVTVTMSDGAPRPYVVSERTMYDKDKLPSARVWARSGARTLVLLTCGGAFDSRRRSFEQNVVVYAVPA